MATSPSTALSQLRDIQLPAELMGEAIAPGWCVLLWIAVVVLFWAGIRIYRKTYLRRIALAEVERLRQRYRVDKDGVALSMGLNLILKRVALLRSARQSVAGLYGEQWLRYLDERGDTEAFSQGVGRVLITAPYGSRDNPKEVALLSLVRGWIRRNT